MTVVNKVEVMQFIKYNTDPNYFIGINIRTHDLLRN
jgi:hypothetical protein